MQKWKRYLRVNQVRYSVVANCLFCAVHCLLLFGVYIIIPQRISFNWKNFENVHALIFRFYRIHSCVHFHIPNGCLFALCALTHSPFSFSSSDSYNYSDRF